MISVVGEEEEVEAEVAIEEEAEAVVATEDVVEAGVAEAVAVIVIIKTLRAISGRTWTISNLNTLDMVTGNVIRITEAEVDISEAAEAAVAVATEEMKVIEETPVRIMVRIMVKIMDRITVRITVRVTISSRIIPAKEILTEVIIEAEEIITMREERAEEEEGAVEGRFRVDGIRVLMIQIATNAVVISDAEVEINIEIFVLLVFLIPVEIYCTELP